MTQGSFHLPMFKFAAFLNEYKGFKNPPVIYVINAGDLKDTGGSWLGIHNLKSMWMAQESPYVPTFKMSAFLNNLKGSRTLLSFMSQFLKLSRTLEVPGWGFIT